MRYQRVEETIARQIRGARDKVCLSQSGPQVDGATRWIGAQFGSGTRRTVRLRLKSISFRFVSVTIVPTLRDVRYKKIYVEHSVTMADKHQFIQFRMISTKKHLVSKMLAAHAHSTRSSTFFGRRTLS